MASGPVTSWQIDGETVETVSDFIFGGSKITADGDCSHEIKRRLLLGRKVMTNLASILKKQRGYFARDHSLVTWSSSAGEQVSLAERRAGPAHTQTLLSNSALNPCYKAPHQLSPDQDAVLRAASPLCPPLPRKAIELFFSACAVLLTHVQFFKAPWTVAHQASLSMEFFRQESWSGLPFPPPEDLPHPGIFFFPTSPKILSPRFDSAPMHRGQVFGIKTKHGKGPREQARLEGEEGFPFYPQRKQNQERLWKWRQK